MDRLRIDFCREPHREPYRADLLWQEQAGEGHRYVEGYLGCLDLRVNRA
jgi:hypothetical protein